MLTDYHVKLNRAGIPVWRPAQPATGREDEHQTALTNWARMMRTQYPALRLYHHIPNGGLRDKRTAARLIGQGVHSGAPDVFIPAARGGYHGIYIELKTGTNKPTPNQNEFMSGAMAEGYYCAVCYGWPCAAAVIEDYLHMGAIPAADVATVVHGELTEHIHELLRAEQDGRLLVLPCKVGDELWSFSTYPTARVYGFTVTDISTLNGRTVLNTLGCGTLWERDIGKTVFLTREEAEKALEARKNG